MKEAKKQVRKNRTKRGSLQSRQRMTVTKTTKEGGDKYNNRIYSVPCFLDLAPGVDTISAEDHRQGKISKSHRGSIVIYSEHKGLKTVKGANMDGLLDLVCDKKTHDKMPGMIEAFIATHTYFIQSDVLMTRLMERFYEAEDEQIEAIFMVWIDTYSEDFKDELELLFRMFLSNIKSKSKEFEKSAEKLASALEKKKAAMGRIKNSLSNSRKSAVSRRDQVPDFELLTSIPAKVLATQLTIIEGKMFRDIPLREFLNKAWEDQSGKSKLPLSNSRDDIRLLPDLIERSNRVSFFVATCILLCSHEKKRRRKMLSYFISVAAVCIQIQNYQTAMQIYSGLNLSPIQKLKYEWKKLGKKPKSQYFDLQTFFDHTGNFKRYRDRMKDIQPPAIPLLSLLLKDLTLIEENDDLLEKEQGIIHFTKMAMIYDATANIKKFLVPGYLYPNASQPVVDICMQLPYLEERDLYKFKGDKGDKVLINRYKEKGKQSKK
eukprot:TRINITY_DN10113_c0_g1_i1.p1 TRINITY_DN10113_c0_g1~~TRINITY_DN10113_c0_g1_i1.p1  ORF type:complete len:489 (-),score=68.20 TRINITY_DN10113_c0_g1_i1:140-1606(-)